MFYSPQTGGFYSVDLHGANIPSDAIDVSASDYVALMEGQQAGQMIVAGPTGHPVLKSISIDIPAGIASRRYQAETAGIVVNGIPLDTGRDSQALVTGAALAAVIDPAYSCQWKTSEGFIDLDAQQIIAIASAMRAHVQACFDREAALLDALRAGTYTDDQLDQGWPA